jgi:hypothetical protein
VAIIGTAKKKTINPNQMKIEAYECDNCGQLKPVDEVVGITEVVDMFDKLLSYPIITPPSKARVHMCVGCYNDIAVASASRQIDRRKDEKEYASKLKETTYMLRSQCVTNYLKKTQKKIVRYGKR